MGKRSVYNFKVYNNADDLRRIVQDFLNANGFEYVEKEGGGFYVSKNMMTGNEYFNYALNGDMLTVEAWVKGAFGEMGIEQTGLMSINIPMMEYRNKLNFLFEKLNNGGKMENNANFGQQDNPVQPINPTSAGPVQQPVVQQPMPQPAAPQPVTEPVPQPAAQPQQMVTQQAPVEQTAPTPVNGSFAQDFQDQSMKKKETMCEIGFWISIVGTILAFLGVTFGVVIYILDYYFASQGLKTRKRGKAIATIVLSSVSIAIIVVELVITLLI